MICNTSFFSQVLEQLPRGVFQRHVKDCGTERNAKGFKSWTHLVSMIFCHLARAESLREICNGIAGMTGRISHLGLPSPPPRSTLGYANEHRSSQLFEKYYYSLLEHFRKAGMLHNDRKFRFKAPLKILDSTVISLCHSSYEWAVYRTGKGAAKMHVLLDAVDVMPDYVHISEGCKHDLVMKKLLRVPEGTIVVFDRGYNDHGFYDDLISNGVHFVTKMHSNTLYDVVKEEHVPYSISHVILANQVVRISKSSYYYRRVVAMDEETGKEVALLSSLLDFGPSTISNIYRARWVIEEFFRQIKQNLCIRTFVGTSQNAFEIQIWTALIALLILTWLKHRSQSKWSFSVLAAIVRFILLSNIDLDHWLQDPTGQMAQLEGSGQMKLVFG
jgi:hypothetical protein